MSPRKRSTMVRANTPPSGFRLDGPLPQPVALAGLRPVPTPPRHERDPAVDRKVFCPNYDACLDVAARQGWDDFSCRQCSFAREVPAPSADRYAEDRPNQGE